MSKKISELDPSVDRVTFTVAGIEDDGGVLVNKKRLNTELGLTTAEYIIAAPVEAPWLDTYYVPALRPDGLLIKRSFSGIKDQLVNDLNLVNKAYIDAADAALNTAITGKVAKAGDVMTGPLTLPGAPTVPLHAATKGYVDAADTALSTAISGKIGEAPNDGQQYARKNLAWAVVAAGTSGVPEAPNDAKTYGRKSLGWVDISSSLTGFVLKAGDTMTGPLVLPGNPTLALQAAPKQYVDAADLTLTNSVNTKIGEAPNDGQQYARKNLGWTVVVSGGGGIAEAPVDTKTYARKDAAWVDITASLATNYLPLTGGTLSGDLLISKASPAFELNASAAGQGRWIVSRTGSLARWSIEFGSSAAESGGNAGSDFGLNRYNDAGTYLSTPLIITRNTGDAQFTGDITVNKGTPQIVLNKAVGANLNAITGNRAGVPRWQLQLGDAQAESTGNVGSGFALNRYNDAGTYTGQFLTALRYADSLVLPLGQLGFPVVQNPSSDAQTLDDYEEGAWVPNFEFAGNSVGVAYTNRIGYYIKSGRMVIFMGRLTLSSKGSSTGAARVGNLPFTIGPSWGGCSVGYAGAFLSLTGALQMVPENNYININQHNATGAVGITNTNVSASADIIFGGQYLASN